jgi:hypothetical protein
MFKKFYNVVLQFCINLRRTGALLPGLKSYGLLNTFCV